jgi:peptidyl-prolyl cis-trans isomerase B (cyclophilin B)
LPDAAIDALTDTDDELVFTAASLLKDNGRHEAVQPLLDALMRLSKKLGPTGPRQTGRQTAAPTLGQMATLASARDTSRDARVSILMALQNLAESADGLPSLLRNLLADTDPVVASTTADVISRFVAKRPIPRPTKYAPIQPSEADIVNRPRCGSMLLDNGTQIDLTMDMANAPIASARFLMLATDKFYDGLTFHRVEPNSFVQAGSPDANELSNGDRFIRDEIATPVLADRVAFVSRGPDTAAGQFFVAQADLPMFDHEFTVFATMGPSLWQLLRDGKIVEGSKITSIREGTCKVK